MIVVVGPAGPPRHLPRIACESAETSRQLELNVKKNTARLSSCRIPVWTEPNPDQRLGRSFLGGLFSFSGLALFVALGLSVACFCCSCCCWLSCLRSRFSS